MYIPLPVTKQSGNDADVNAWLVRSSYETSRCAPGDQHCGFPKPVYAPRDLKFGAKDIDVHQPQGAQQHQQQGRRKMPPKRRPAATAPHDKKVRPSKLAKENSITAAEESEIHSAFTLFSTPHDDYPDSKDGVIPTRDVRRALVALGTPPSHAAELRELIDAVDPDEAGYATYEHFVAIAALKLKSRGEDSKREEVEEAFRLFAGGRELITLKDLKRIAAVLKEDVVEQVLRDMMMEANGGGGVHKGVGIGEFEAVMRRAGVFS